MGDERGKVLNEFSLMYFFRDLKDSREIQDIKVEFGIFLKFACV